MNSKPVIGIVPTSNYMLSDDAFKDTYSFGNNYIKKIIENGGIPLLIPYCNDEMIVESLKLCDGLILPGGSRVLPTTFKVIDYFYKNNKPILGICLGMQTLGMYSMKLDDKDKRIIKKIDNGINHWPVELMRDNISEVVHKDIVKVNSKLYDVIGQEEIFVNSVHKNIITEVGSSFCVSIVSEDGLIEGIECIEKEKFVIGVQFHPEILPQYNMIFEKFLNRCRKNSN